MKTRESLVSNSSSSSFVMIGYSTTSIEEAIKLIKPDEYEEILAESKDDSEDQYKDNLSDLLYVISNDPSLELDVRTGDGDYYIGKLVSEQEDWGMPSNTLNGNDIENWIDGVHKLTKAEDKPGLIVGTRAT